MAQSDKKAAIDEHEFDDLVASLTRGMMKPADQLKRLNRLVSSGNTFTCAHLQKVIDICADIKVECIALFYPSLSDPDAIDGVIKTLKWKADQDAAKAEIEKIKSAKK